MTNKTHTTCDMFDINGTDKLTNECVELREDIIREHAKNPKTVCYANLSGGKDGQAMLIQIKTLFPKERIVLIHANLGEVEHDGVIEHIEKFAEQPLNVVRNEKKTFLEMVMLRGFFPSAKFRQCTSDLKVNPIFKFIRAHMKEHGYTTAFNVTGLRAEESRGRALKSPLWINKTLTLKSGIRTVFDWMPVFHFSTASVFKTIEEAGQHPHPIYGKHGEKNERLSCVLCILSSKNDLFHGANNYPDHYAEMVALEKLIDHTMFGRSKTIRTSSPMKKGDLLDGFKVTSCRLLKKQINGRNQFSNTVFIPVSVAEKAGVRVNELLVAKKLIELRKRQQTLKTQVAADKQLKSDKKKTFEQTSIAQQRDTQTIDIFEVAG